MRTRFLLVLCLFTPVAHTHAAAPDEFIDPTAPEVATILKAGEAATGQVAMKLVGELTVALSSGGPVSAIDVCHLKAMPLTEEKLPTLPQVTAIKRTSLKLRNPVNAPDAAEQRALDRVAGILAAGGEAPPFLVQKIPATTESPAEWRVYRSVLVQQACVACHGDPAKQSPELRTILAARYPKDAATGYRTGDFRGLIRATVASAPNPTN